MPGFKLFLTDGKVNGLPDFYRIAYFMILL